MDPPSQMLNRSYGIWPPPPVPPLPDDQQQPKFPQSQRPPFASSRSKNNWKGKKKDILRRNDPPIPAISTALPGGGVGGAYKPPKLNELQSQNRLKARRFYPKKKFNRFAPFAPRNTTSFIIRAKKSGGIASLASPCPVTPAILPTPIFSPSREVLVDMAKEEWGVDGYGSMNGLIRLRSPARDEDEEEEGGGGSSDSDVEEHLEVERRLDHDLSRFEMIYPANNLSLENRVDDQEAHIAQLEEENLTLRERLFLMERELEDLRRRVQFLETDGGHGLERVRDNNQEEASDNERCGDVCSVKSVGDDGDGV
ncbi:hypothetical protein RJ641_004843 [Dillenia turbinata]|uniref:PRLI-interacting factor A n=1 Tax=Dillenia turbinata TaxID=194707 RepID=A0AAN8ZCI7_9MAGN